ncbi:iron-responsive transcriptional regulator RirA [Oharaeibacter diazotrophicus]|uniref:BadM/Rrf2 family transcriptional regulator n=1 Tax=Oharaeibacter diazotrophicus TaxID=1920512 RepID=A0A4R6R578_9HYPH|nr:iron-responsive transcriptional regulator RirA [Oharaeibacter diazotrophicus]TDP80932.1 BadM/Rrf2 family transcriptional regulator [Oharaeibacter diazotrophicus]BBE73827.1 Rrf2 family transcriptional regulator [Pleomorphomonas sp. SM30]GLS74689.1 protein aau3 [Oharaeibacter diazotrophicus]
MRLTQQTNYSVRLLLYCAANAGVPSRVADIAASFDMSETHLFKILKVLVDAELVKTVRGRNGGVMLARPAEEITIGEVVRAAEESFALADCFDDGGHDCPLVQSCEYNRILREALGAFFVVLDRYTIADVARDRPDLRFLLGIEDALRPPTLAAS